MKPAIAAQTIVVLTASFALSFGAMAQTGPVAATPAVQKVSVKGVARFDFNKATVVPEDGDKLMKEVRSMQNVTWQTISVTGHTDSIGSDDANLTVSERRAEAVQAYLIEKGVKPEKIKAEGKGKKLPVASNKTAAGRAQNRRAEIEFVGLQSLAAADVPAAPKTN